MYKRQLVRQAGLYDCSGSIVQEWWQLRESLLGTCSGSAALSSNYFRMYRVNNADLLYALVIDDNDADYEDIDTAMTRSSSTVRGQMSTRGSQVTSTTYLTPD